MKIARVFPRRTKATPIDDLAFYDTPDLFPPDVDAIHVSVAFTYDLPRAEKLAKAWKAIGPVSIGGPALGGRGEAFTPGKYLRHGYTITSRGCPNRCWFCSVWKREGPVRELPVRDGWNVLDDNLLACSDEHIRSVFAMVKRQNRRAEFTGGLEAARLKGWHVDGLRDCKPHSLFFAYDTPDDLEPLRHAGKMLIEGGFTVASHSLRAYVIMGYPNDTMEKAEKRLRETMEAGFLPMAMLWRDEHGERDRWWMKFQSQWARPARIVAREYPKEASSERTDR